MIFIKKNNSGKFLLLTLLLHFILSEIDDNICIYLWKKWNIQAITAQNILVITNIPRRSHVKRFK